MNYLMSLPYEELKKKIGERVKSQRKKLTNPETGKRYTQTDFADILGTSRERIGKIENGTDVKTALRIDELQALCKIFDCESGYLLGEFDKPTREIANVSEVTGLSYEAINKLKNEKNAEGFSIAELINFMIQDDMCSLIESICEYANYIREGAEALKELGENKKYIEEGIEISKTYYKHILDTENKVDFDDSETDEYRKRRHELNPYYVFTERYGLSGKEAMLLADYCGLFVKENTDVFGITVLDSEKLLKFTIQDKLSLMNRAIKEKIEKDVLSKGEKQNEED